MQTAFEFSVTLYANLAQAIEYKCADMHLDCKIHDQNEWDCYLVGEEKFHLMKPPEQWRNSNLKLKQMLFNCNKVF